MRLGLAENGAMARVRDFFRKIENTGTSIFAWNAEGAVFGRKQHELRIGAEVERNE